MNNAQLIKTLAKKRTANFREDETRLLISLWGSPQIQNKLNLTHRKAPVMRLIAANMQQRGFYRSPDEIKTRIRNLKCLYHRIKRTITSGSGIGTVDPDWPHFKAMDAILGDSSSQSSKTTNGPSNGIKPDLDGNVDTHFEIKQEIDINDDLESWNGNESQGSEYDDDLGPASLPEPAITITTTPTPVKTTAANNNTSNNTQPKIVMGQAGNQITSQTTRTITCTPQTIRPTGQPPNLTLPSSIPLPFLILNSLKPAQTGIGNQNISNSDGPPPNKRKKDSMDDNGYGNALHQLIDIQKQLLEIDKQRLEVEKQRLEFDRVVGSQLMTLVPMMGSLIQRLVFPHTDVMNKTFDMMDQQSDEHLENNNDMQEINNTPDEVTNQRTRADDELEKNRNILRNLLNQGLKARMMEDQRKEAEEQQAEIQAVEIEKIANENAIENEIEDNNAEEQNVDKDKVDEELDNDINEENENVENAITNDEINDNDDNESVCSVLLINENSAGTNDENNDE